MTKQRHTPRILTSCLFAAAALTVSAATPQAPEGVPVPHGKGPLSNSRITLAPEETEWLQEHSTIRIGVDPDFAPFEFIDEAGLYRGIAADYIELLGERLGITFSVTPNLSWIEAVNMAKQGDLDLLPCVGISEEHKQYFTYSTPYLGFPRVIITHRDSPISSMQDLTGTRVAVQRNSSDHGYLIENTAITPLLYDTFRDALCAVSEGAADAAIGNLAVADYEMLKLGLTNLRRAAHVSEEISPLAFAVRQDWPIFVGILNKGLASMPAAETLGIHQKWIGVGQNARYTPPLLALAPPFSPIAHLLRSLAAVFLAMGALLAAAWVIKGRPRQLSIARILFVTSFVFACLIVAIAAFATMLLDTNRQLSAIDSDVHDAHDLANELSQSSDELTRLARTFVATGTPAYEHYFRTIVDIREGRQARPDHTNRSYWDLATDGSLRPSDAGDRCSIEEKISRLKLPEQEQSELMQAKRESDYLIELGLAAIHAIQGRFVDPEGQFTVEGTPDPKLARQSLHGQAYHEARARVMLPIERFLSMKEIQTSQKRSVARARGQAIILGITILTAITIAFAVYVFLLLRRRVIAPLALLQRSAHLIESGDYSQSVDLHTKDEAGALAGAFNAMAANVRERTSRLHATIESTTDGILVVDLNQRITTYNARFLTIWGLDTKRIEAFDNSEELLITSMKRVVKSDPEQFVTSIKELYAHPERADFTTLTLRDGRVLERYSMPQRLDEEIMGRVWSFRDVTERHHAAEELRRSEKSLRRTQSIAKLGHWTHDHASNQRVWSDELFHIFGLQPQTAVACAQTFLDCVHPDDRERVNKAYLDSIQEDHGGFEIEHRIVRQDTEEVRHVYQKCEHVRSDTGEVVRSEGMLQDITNRARADEKLRQLSQAIEQSPTAVIISNTNGIIEYVNPRFCKLTGYGPEEVVGQNPRILKTGEHPKDMYQQLWGTITAGRVWHGELCNQKKNGERYWEAASIAPVKRDDGQITHFVAVMIDISERKRDEQAIERQNERLRVLQQIVSTPQQSENEEIQSIIRESCRLLGMERAYIGHAENAGCTVEHAFPAKSPDPTQSSQELGSLPCSLVIDAKRTVLEQDLAASPFHDSSLYGRIDFQSCAGTRIRTSHGNYGVVAFTRKTPRPMPFDDQDHDFLQVIAGVIGAILDRLLSRDELIRHTRELERFNLAMVNRELRMISLKEEVNALAEKLGEPAPYSASHRTVEPMLAPLPRLHPETPETPTH